MIRVGPRKQVDADHWRGRLRQARDYRAAAREALILAESDRNCAPAVSTLILAAIAYADALTARHGQVVNQKDHAAGARLLREVLGNNLSDVNERRYRRLLGRKDEVQYGVRPVLLDDALRVQEDLEALADWAEDRLA